MRRLKLTMIAVFTVLLLTACAFNDSRNSGTQPSSLIPDTQPKQSSESLAALSVDEQLRAAQMAAIEPAFWREGWQGECYHGSV